MKTVLLVGPSIDLPRARRAAWVREQVSGSKPTVLIGVDGGIQFLRSGGGRGSRQPDFVIGDWDSGDVAVARKFAREGARMVTLPQRKDRNDLGFALEEAARLDTGKPTRPGPSELLLIGFTGGRPDHLLANLFEIAGFAAAQASLGASRPKFQKIAAIGPEAEYHFLTRQHPLELTRDSRNPAGTLVSVFALCGPVRGVTMTGFEYCLKNALLQPSSRGLSNVVRARRAVIRVSQGTLVVVIPRA